VDQAAATALADSGGAPRRGGLARLLSRSACSQPPWARTLCFSLLPRQMGTTGCLHFACLSAPDWPIALPIGPVFDRPNQSVIVQSLDFGGAYNVGKDDLGGMGSLAFTLGLSWLLSG
jgi:hypothetical protein